MISWIRRHCFAEPVCCVYEAGPTGFGLARALTKRRWTKAFRRWAASLEFDEPCDTFAFRRKLEAVFYLEGALSEIDDEIRRSVGASRELAETVGRLSAVHGIGPVTAFSLAAEVYDFHRFRRGSTLSAYMLG